jgi:hypothetical protein
VLGNTKYAIGVTKRSVVGSVEPSLMIRSQFVVVASLIPKNTIYRVKHDFIPLKKSITNSLKVAV